MVFSDTPGVIDTKYGLQKSMMKVVDESLEDADLLLFLFDGTKEISAMDEIAARYGDQPAAKMIAINKCDVADAKTRSMFAEQAARLFPGSEVFFISALKQDNLQPLLAAILNKLPEQPAFFSGEELTDRSERFIVSELIREKIFEQFQQEIPYSTEVTIQEWKEENEMTKIRADIVVERETQKAILLGKGGAAIKNLGIEARKSVEQFLQKKIFLGLTIKVNSGWRNSDRMLKYFGYEK